MFTELILRDQKRQRRSLASGEFRYTFVANRVEEISLWFYAFKSINIFAFTLSPACPTDMKAEIAGIEWPLPDELRRSD